VVGNQIMIAIGIGCRRNTKATEIECLVRQALASAPTGGQPALFTIEDKASEPGLIEAARALDLPLTFLPRTTLRAQTTPTSSPRTRALFGVPSVAEAAALAGAGPNATLIVPRIIRNGVTCAIAREGVIGSGPRTRDDTIATAP
jgi:cobalt-precorrin 5A hydrolase